MPLTLPQIAPVYTALLTRLSDSSLPPSEMLSAINSLSSILTSVITDTAPEPAMCADAFKTFFETMFDRIGAPFEDWSEELRFQATCCAQAWGGKRVEGMSFVETQSQFLEPGRSQDDDSALDHEGSVEGSGIRSRSSSALFHPSPSQDEISTPVREIVDKRSNPWAIGINPSQFSQSQSYPHGPTPEDGLRVVEDTGFCSGFDDPEVDFKGSSGGGALPFDFVPSLRVASHPGVPFSQSQSGYFPLQEDAAGTTNHDSGVPETRRLFEIDSRDAYSPRKRRRLGESQSEFLPSTSSSSHARTTRAMSASPSVDVAFKAAGASNITRRDNGTSRAGKGSVDRPRYSFHGTEMFNVHHDPSPQPNPHVVRKPIAPHADRTSRLDKGKGKQMDVREPRKRSVGMQPLHTADISRKGPRNVTPGSSCPYFISCSSLICRT